MTVAARELKNRLGTYLRRVRQGETLLVTDRGRPIAELRPVSPAAIDLPAKYHELAARGLLTLPSRQGPTGHRPVKLPGGQLSETIISDRQDRL